MSFTFGQQSGGNTPNKPLFGAASNTSGGTAPSIFGTSNTGNTGASTPGGSGLFGGGAPAGSSNLFGGGASSTPASKPGGLFGGGGGATSGASTPGLFGGSGLSKPAGDTAKPSSVFGGGFGAASAAGTGAVPTPSFGFGTTACTCPACAFLACIANKETQHPHPQPHPQRTSSSRRRHPQALLPVPVCSVRRTRKQAQTLRQAHRCSVHKSHRLVGVRRLAQDSLADSLRLAVRVNPAHLYSEQSWLRHLPRLLPACSVVRVQASLWEAQRLHPVFLEETKTLRLVQTKLGPPRLPHPLASLEAERQLARKHKELPNRLYSHLKPHHQHLPASLRPSALVQHPLLQRPHNLLRA
jgi:hypothetical protein